MIPTPIRQVLSTIQKSRVRALLMGGQACVLYGAAQVSRDVDLLLLAEADNFQSFEAALENLQTRRIAVPPFSPEVLGRGHAVHFRCHAAGAEGLRIDVMTQLPGVGTFPELWERRTVVQLEDGPEVHLLSIPDLVHAKKTQREKDWPIIELLMLVHYRLHAAAPEAEQIEFWLKEVRTPEVLCEISDRFAEEAARLTRVRPLLNEARAGGLDALRAALDVERRAVQAEDRAYWVPLRRELEEFRRQERQAKQKD